MIEKLSRKDIELLELITNNETSKKRLAEYLDANKKKENAWKIYRDSLLLSDKNDSKEQNSKEESAQKFEVGDKVRILSTEFPLARTTKELGETTIVIGYKDNQNLARPVITANKDEIKNYFDESVLELVVKKEKTLNDLRAETIKKAQEFVGDLPSTAFIPVKKGFIASKPEFVINEKERTVTALFTDVNSGIVAYETVAKCHPKDIFNADIGKAVAWGRALNKDVSEFEDTVQPTLTKGQVAKFTPRYEGRELEIQIKKVDGEKLWFANKYGVEMYLASGVSNSDIKIASDTYAQYGDVNDE